MLPCFPKWLCHFTLPLVAYESSSSFISSPTLNRVNPFFFFFSHSFYGHPQSIWKFSGQSKSKTQLQPSLQAEETLDPLTHCTGLGIKPAPLQRPELLQSATVPEQEVWVHLFFFFFVFLGLHPQHMDVPKLRGWIRAVAAILLHSYSNRESKLHLWPIPQFMAIPGSLTHWVKPGIKAMFSWILTVSFPLIPNGNSWINLFLKFLAIPLCGWHCVIILLICICLVTINIEHPSICLFTINICSQKVSLKTFWLYF